MCHLNDDKKLDRMPIMLSGHKFNYFEKNCHKCSNYGEAKGLLQRWDNNSDIKSRFSMEWQWLTLSI